jgi:hypothetical protein
MNAEKSTAAAVKRYVLILRLPKKCIFKLIPPTRSSVISLPVHLYEKEKNLRTHMHAAVNSLKHCPGNA